MDWDREDLRAKLGQEKVEKFAEEYLVANGETQTSAAAIVRETEAEDVRRQETFRENKELDRLRQVSLEEHIYVGLADLPSPPSDFDEEQSNPKACSGWFSAANLAVVLERCKKHGIKITMMQHYSSNPDLDRFEMHYLRSPLDILEKWKADGCNGSFHAICRVPNSLLK